MSILLVLPCLWIVMTAERSQEGTLELIVGTVLSYALVVGLMWYHQRQGLLLAHRCGTCKGPMRLSKVGELKPPRDMPDAPDRLWRCHRCGRLERP